MQFVPAIIGGIYWKGAARAGAAAGLDRRLPAVDLYAAAAVLRALGLDRRRPSSSMVPFGPCGTQAVCAVRAGRAGPDGARRDWTMLVNVGLFVGVSLLTSQWDHRAQPGGAVRRHLQAPRRIQGGSGAAARPIGDLRQLLVRFIGEVARECGACASRARARAAPSTTRVTPSSARSSPMRSGSLPARSARRPPASWWRRCCARRCTTSTRWCKLLDEASQLVVYSRQLEQKSRELEAATTELHAPTSACRSSTG